MPFFAAAFAGFRVAGFAAARAGFPPRRFFVGPAARRRARSSAASPIVSVSGSADLDNDAFVSPSVT